MRMQAIDWSRPTSERSERTAKLHHLFDILNREALAYSAGRDDDWTPETLPCEGARRQPRELRADAIARLVVTDFARLFPRESLDEKALSAAIDEWVPTSVTTDPKRRGGRRKGRTGKFNALAAAIAKTTFAQKAQSLEQALKDWRKLRGARKESGAKSPS